MSGQQIQRRRGTTAEHATFTGAVGELTVDTTKDTVVVHDATKVGGYPLAREDLSNVAVKAANMANGGAELGMRNRIINGGCQIAQRGQSLVVASGGTPQVYGGPDRFATQNFNAGGQFTQSQSDMVFQGVSRKAVRQTVNTANTSLTGANYWLGICQVIEGVNSFDLPGSPVALSFIFNTSVSGTFSVAVRDSLASQSYVTTFSAVANTPKKVVISIATIPLTVNIPNSNADGVRLTIGTLNTGALQTTQTNIWQVGNFLCAAGATNWGSAAGNFIELTELQFEKGPTATPFEYRPYGMELALCQRYLQIKDVHWTWDGAVGGIATASVHVGLSPTMRSVPTVSVASSANLNITQGPISATSTGFESRLIFSDGGTIQSRFLRTLYQAASEL